MTNFFFMEDLNADNFKSDCFLWPEFMHLSLLPTTTSLVLTALVFLQNYIRLRISVDGVCMVSVIYCGPDKQIPYEI